jgi:LuxR family maltose regulon positive regulatory protein
VPTSVAGTILATKLRAPPARSGLLARSPLVVGLGGADARPLTLVTAPAGSGKTTLLAAWAASPERPGPFAWLALDEADDDPVRFWAYVIAALREVWPGVGNGALAHLGMRPVRLVEDVVPSLLNEIARRDGTAVLVLDDLHLVARPDVHASLALLVERLPPNLRIAIASRSEPPLPIARLRARRALAEVSGTDLRFTDQEAAELISEVLGRRLAQADVAVLQQRTEGWAAGLYLAALSLRGREDTAAFIAQFAGDHRHLVDYLGGEVLAGQPPARRRFLLRSSVLSRLSAPLCDAVLGGDGAAEQLDAIRRENLFLVGLDESGTWFRYHHLFAELLRHELARIAPGETPQLHARASEWHERHGQPAEAIEHSLAGGDADRASRLVAAHWNDVFNRGELGTVGRWLDALPAGAVAGHPELCTAGAWLALDGGHLDDVGRWIDAADAALAGWPDDEELAAGVDVLHAVHDFKLGRLGAAAEAAESVLRRRLDAPAFPHTVGNLILAAARHWHGVADPEPPLVRALELARAEGNELAVAYASGYHAAVEAGRGDRWAAEDRLAAAHAQLELPGVREHFVTSLARLAAAEIALDSGDLALAEAHAGAAVELADRGGGLPERAAARLALARARHARGGSAAGRPLVEEARRMLARCPDPGRLALDVDRTERALRRTPGRPAHELGDLTDRELAVARLLRSELTLREIAGALRVSQNTVKTHLRGIYRKLDATTRDEAVARGRALGLW